MRVLPAAAAVDIAFDDPNLIADAGLVSVVTLAGQVGLTGLVSFMLSTRDAVARPLR